MAHLLLLCCKHIGGKYETVAVGSVDIALEWCDSG